MAFWGWRTGKSRRCKRDTLRHYERKGVLPRPQRSPNGYREYPAAALERVRMIRRALAVGFTLDELHIESVSISRRRYSNFVWEICDRNSQHATYTGP
ncbi:MAG: MerR family transcriptional regulator [Acidobacteria bacterium]|nr:MerR family transcriptional regulator [Acidobacteriota bacterium]